MISSNFNPVKEEVKKILKHPDQSVAHQWPHTKSVLIKANLLVKIASKSGIEVDLEKLMLAILGHDIVQYYYIAKIKHVKNSTKKFGPIMRRHGYSEKTIEEVTKIMSEHSSEIIRPPSRVESIILFIADKWDASGPEGVKRVLAYGKQRGMSEAKTIQWYKIKIEKARPLFLELIKVIPGSEIALKDVEYSLEYIKQFEKQSSKLAV